MENLSFYDIQDLQVNNDIKDELTLAFLHGFDMTKYLGHSNVTYDILRGVRLCFEHDVPAVYIDNNLNGQVLKALADLYGAKRTLESTKLDRYFRVSTYRLTLEPQTFVKLVDLALKDVDIAIVNFSYIPITHVDLFVNALQQQTNVRDIIEHLGNKSVEQVDFLISLRQAGISITPFLQGDWTEKQIAEILSGKSKIAPAELIKNYVNEFFTAGQIFYVLKAFDYNCAEIVSSIDHDKYPVFNEYQMYNIVEGARFGLDYMRYARPDYNDFKMSEIRNAMLEEKERLEAGSVQSRLAMSKPVRFASARRLDKN